ncbi:hypothetical protein HELRODRAFT_169862 [Helobdella robusta]|uniref:Uncharacterized protein n=1 Tax=Helobdella robusta TaxID=6412 RepID=T1F2D9_HELRO|nr:hypothetical protein HELRODRAFT_169862 [Helobdella robusta]ESO08126.1 hypothetical protein HELRODRAFT_169862 [Helobdella robusta]
MKEKEIEKRTIGNRIKNYIVGCTDPPTPPSGWMKRTGNKAESGCQPNKVLWRMTCHVNSWVGDEIGMCDGEGRSADAWNGDLAGSGGAGGGSNDGLLAVVGIGIVLGIVLGFSMLTIAVAMLRKRNRQKQPIQVLEKLNSDIYQQQHQHQRIPSTGTTSVYNQATTTQTQQQQMFQQQSKYQQQQQQQQTRDVMMNVQTYAPIADLLLSSDVIMNANDGSYRSSDPDLTYLPTPPPPPPTKTLQFSSSAMPSFVK